MRFTIPFVLASQSPRRRQLLSLIGADFDAVPSESDEEYDEESPPERIVESLALLKAATVSAQRPEALVLGADTIVVLDGEILNKPQDEDDAARMLACLSGRTHSVYTGIALIHSDGGRSVTANEHTRVTFAELDDEEISEYVRSGSPLDKAGAYGIQDDRGALYVSRIEGDYYNVVGLPLQLLYRTLRRDFSDLIAPATADHLRPNLYSGANPT
jgi:septum formation protein